MERARDLPPGAADHDAGFAAEVRAVPSPVARPHVDPPAVARRVHRAAPAIALALGAGLGVALLPLLPVQSPATDLVPLLLGMAAIKGLLAAAGAAILAWRLGFAVERGIARRYLVAVALGGAAAVLIAGHVVPLAGAALFHVGELLFLATAWQDGRAAR